MIVFSFDVTVTTCEPYLTKKNTKHRFPRKTKTLRFFTFSFSFCFVLILDLTHLYLGLAVLLEKFGEKIKYRERTWKKKVR